MFDESYLKIVVLQSFSKVNFFKLKYLRSIILNAFERPGFFISVQKNIAKS